jgi:hypothetical protein
VWADVEWQARGGPLIAAPGGLNAAIARNTMIRKAFPGTSTWWGHLTKAWWAAVPGPTNAHGLICAPTSDSLIQSLVRTYPRAAGVRINSTGPLPQPAASRSRAPERPGWRQAGGTDGGQQPRDSPDKDGGGQAGDPRPFPPARKRDALSNRQPEPVINAPA